MAVQPGTPHYFVRRLEMHDFVSNLLPSIMCPLGLALFSFAVLESRFCYSFRVLFGGHSLYQQFSH